MRILYAILCLMLAFVSDAFADSFSGDELGTVVGINTDTVVNSGVLFAPDLVSVNGTIDFINYGAVDTVFSVCNRCDVHVYNHGDFVADFILGEDASVVQVVSGADNWNPILSNVKYTLMIDGVSELGNRAVLDGYSLQRVVIKDSVLRLSDISWNHEVNTDLRGDIVFIVDDLSGLYGVPVIDNVSGDGNVRIASEHAHPLYADVGYVIDNQLFVKRVRETDYKKIFGNDMGVFLNNLRRQNPDDGLLQALDAAKDMNALNDIMGRSVRMNRDLLLRSVRVLGGLNNMFPNAVRTGFDVNFNGVLSDDFYSYAVGAGISGGFDRLKLGMGVYLGNVEYVTELDEFVGMYYGLNLGAEYLMQNNLFVRGAMNVMRFDFDIGDAFYNDEVINNPSVIYAGSMADFGYRYNFADSFYAAPFVGMDVIGTNVADVLDIDVRGRIGVDVGYMYQLFGISYDYGVEINTNSDNEFMANVRAGFWSEYDGAGANVDLTVSRMFGVCSYKMSIGGKLWF